MSEPAQEYNKALNRLLMRVTRRAEKSTAEYLTRTFVPVEPVPGLLESSDNQVIYGRRGTGKTHLLKYIAESKKRDGDIALYMDLRTIGSSGGLYADISQPLALRATHLLVGSRRRAAQSGARPGREHGHFRRCSGRPDSQSGRPRDSSF
jgi:hypothetical protein